MLELAILGLLDEQELHGYEIRKRLRDELGLFANISFGSLYPALSRLERVGAVTVTEDPAAPPRPVPTTGSLSGERAALRARRAGRRPRDQRSPQGLPDHRRGPAAVRRAPRRRGAGRGRRRPQLRPAPGLRPPPGPPGPPAPARAPPGPADPAPGRRPGAAAVAASASTSTPARSSSTPPSPPSTTSPGSTGSSRPSAKQRRTAHRDGRRAHRPRRARRGPCRRRTLGAS